MQPRVVELVRAEVADARAASLPRARSSASRSAAGTAGDRCRARAPRRRSSRRSPSRSARRCGRCASESTGSPGSSSATLVSAQFRNPSNGRPARSAPRRAWSRASATGTPRGGIANTRPSPYSAGQLHGARTEAGDVERDPRLQVHVLLVVHEDLDRARDAAERVVDDLAAQQRAQHAEIFAVRRRCASAAGPSCASRCCPCRCRGARGPAPGG